MDPVSNPGTEPEPDPLYDPAYMAFVYGAWSGVSAIFSQRLGLVALVFGAVTLLLAGSRSVAERGARPFRVDFASILVFCSASLAAGVLALDVAAGS